MKKLKLIRDNEVIEITKEQFRNFILNCAKEKKRREKLNQSELGRKILKNQGIDITTI